MDQYGNAEWTTPQQRAEVLRLRESGESIRQIAEIVFGDKRFRGRVERVLANEPGRASEAGRRRLFDPTLAEIDASSMTNLELLRLFVDRRLALAVESGMVPSTAELRQLLEIQQRLDAAAALERLKEARRRPAGDRRIRLRPS